MKDLFDFLLAPARRTPWRVATLFGVFLGLILFVGNTFPVTQPLATGLSVATCFTAGILGASRGREFDQGIATVFAAIVTANVVAAVVIVASLAGTHSASAVAEALDLPLPGMLVLGVPVGTVGAGVGAWLSYRRTVA